jgi:uncharacterized Rmd1/YagE family protein
MAHEVLPKGLPGLFGDVRRLPVHACFLAEHIDVGRFSTGDRLASVPAVVRVAETGCAVVFRYGAVVLFNCSPDRTSDFLRELAAHVRRPFVSVEAEDDEILVCPDEEERVEDDVIRLQSTDVPRLQLVASILARSVVLGHYETGILEASSRIEPFVARLRQGCGFGWRRRDLLRHLGEALSIQHRMAGRVEVREKPEVLWNHPELETLYQRLEEEYELRDRSLALERKLDLISRTAQTVLGLLQHRRTLMVEWYIVILIVAEILLSLFELIVLR